MATLQDIHDQLFTDIQGYSLSASGRSRIGRDSDPVLTYGEVTPEGVEYMMSITCPKEGDVFYDLGSGTGKAVILAAAHGPFKRCTGIDIVEDLTQSAQATADRYHIEIKPQFGDAKKDQQVNFIHGDMFEQDLSDGDIFFTHCTCFDDAMMDRMSKKLEECKPGTRVVTVTKGLTSPEFELTQTTPFRMAWGEATLCFYKRK